MEAGIRNPVLRFVVYSHLWLALGAAAQTWWMGEMLWMSDRRSPVLAFCGTLVCYTYMRWSRMDHPELAGSLHLQWFRAHRRTVLALAVAAAIAGVIFAWPFAARLVRSFWPVAAIVALYVVPLRFTAGRVIGMRRIPGLKALLIAFVWAASTVGLPFTLTSVYAENAWWCFGQQFAFFFSLAIAFDLRDLPYDLPSLRTLPQLIGVHGAKFFALLFQAPWIFFFAIMAFLSLSPIEKVTPKGFMVVPMLLPALGHIIAAYLIARMDPERSEAYSSFYLDGTLILIPLLGWIGSYF
jgi:hypothetical protein